MGGVFGYVVREKIMKNAQRLGFARGEIVEM